MKTLNECPEEFDIEFFPGVSVRVRRMGSFEYNLAKTRTSRLINDLAQGKKVIEEVLGEGMTLIDVDLEDPDQRAALTQVVLVKQIAKQQAIGWTGFTKPRPEDAAEDAPDEELPFEIEHFIEVLNDPILSEIFFQGIVRHHSEIAAAKKDCGTGANGMQAAVPNTAPDAAARTQTAAGD